jgi:hypothetical protein
MKQFIDVVDGVGKVLVQKSEEGEPLFIGVVKLGNKYEYPYWRIALGSVAVTIIIGYIILKYKGIL